MSWDSSRSFKSHEGTPTNKYTNSSRNLFDYRLEFQQSNLKNSICRVEGLDGICLKKSLNFFKPEASQDRLSTPGESWFENINGLEDRNKESLGLAFQKRATAKPSPKAKSPRLNDAVRFKELQNLPDRIKLLKQTTGTSLDKPTATRDGSSSPNNTKKNTLRNNQAKAPGLQKASNPMGTSHFSFLSRTDLGLATRLSPPAGSTEYHLFTQLA